MLRQWGVARRIHALARQENAWRPFSCTTASSVSAFFDPDRYSTNYYYYSHQQVRWKRKDGNRHFTKPRPPTKKQRKHYHRNLQKLQAQHQRHGRPGSKAGERREWTQSLIDDYLQDDDTTRTDPSFSLEYGVEDALLDDLIGNTQALTSQPTPEPLYYGHLHQQYHEQLVQQYQQWTIQQQQQQQQQQPMVVRSLPSDRIISLALKSFRDAHGSRSRPVGLVRALEYLLQEVGLPIASFGEQTYVTLLTCCQSPAQGQRVIQLQRHEQLPVSTYSWSCLVDLCAKVGDYQQAAQVMQDMVADGVPPTLPAYTSFLAACYKVCNDGRVPHAERAKAANAALEKWEEMRVVGIDPDVMAYGAMLRLCAAQGHPERALNLLEEMQRFEIKPTTLCFTSALRAVAKSQATAIRYERGSSRRNLRRETITRHHGKMARNILIQAENAEVVQDDGFVAALILCAAEAGDVATAKAIYVASQIRKLDQLRTIGPDSHLARLRGESVSDQDRLGMAYHQSEDLSNSRRVGTYGAPDTSLHLSESHSLAVRDSSLHSVPASFAEREYGKDSRVLSAILHACARSTDKNGIGTMWQGRENKGYLCENSLRLITARRLPRYEDTSIPGQRRTDDLTWEGEYKDEDYRDGKRRSRKFSGVDVSEDGASTLEELDDKFARMFVDEEGRLKPEFRKTTPEDIWQMKYGKEPASEAGPELSDGSASTDNATAKLQASHQIVGGRGAESSDKLIQEDGEVQEELYFDKEVMRWRTREKLPGKDKPVTTTFDEGTRPSIRGMAERGIVSNDALSQDETEEELYFDSDEMKWKTRIISKSKPFTDFEARVLDTKIESKEEVSRVSQRATPYSLHVTSFMHGNSPYFRCFYLDRCAARSPFLLAIRIAGDLTCRVDLLRNTF